MDGGRRETTGLDIGLDDSDLAIMESLQHDEHDTVRAEEPAALQHHTGVSASASAEPDRVKTIELHGLKVRSTWVVDKSAVVSIPGPTDVSTAQRSGDGVATNATNKKRRLARDQSAASTIASTEEQNDDVSLRQTSAGDQVEWLIADGATDQQITEIRSLISELRAVGITEDEIRELLRGQ